MLAAMSEPLSDLFAHQAWADARHWRAIRAWPAALEDPALRRRLHHIHIVQLGFLGVMRQAPVRYTEVTDYPDFARLQEEVQRYHEDAAASLAAATPADLAREVEVPWFKDPPCRIRLSEALHQVVMHSHYHRGQNATRLRELGADPPNTDFIVWLWKGRPAARWP
jgi:uncharacterized damage-inducible protein DinB